MKKRFLSAILAAMACLSILPAAAFSMDYKVPVNSTRFPDPSFLAYVQTLPGAEDGILSMDELLKISTLDCSNRGISDLTGVTNFLALSSLDCSGNRLTRLDVSQLPNLTELDCSRNQLTSLDLERSGTLKTLNCQENWLPVDEGAVIAETMPGFNTKKVVSDAQGGRFAYGKVFFDRDSSEIAYRYAAGKEYSLDFRLRKAHSFADVTPGDWFFDGVRYTTAKGLFKGISDAQFGPKLPMSRAMVVQVLYSMAGKPQVDKTHRFPDVKDGDWFSDAVAWAVQEGVASGYADGRFAPNDEVNREQLAVMLHGYMKKPAAATGLDFADAQDVSGWARPALAWAVENHLMGGVPGNKILPQGLAERSQGTVIMMNFDKLDK